MGMLTWYNTSMVVNGWDSMFYWLKIVMLYRVWICVIWCTCWCLHVYTCSSIYMNVYIYIVVCSISNKCHNSWWCMITLYTVFNFDEYLSSVDAPCWYYCISDIERLSGYSEAMNQGYEIIRQFYKVLIVDNIMMATTYVRTTFLSYAVRHSSRV